MRFKLEIEMSNADFDDLSEDARYRNGRAIVRCLKHLAAKVPGSVRDGDEWPALDHNGNTVGFARVEE